MYSTGKVLCCSQVGNSNVATASLAWQLRLQASRRCIQFETESRSDKTAAAAASSHSWSWKLRFFMSVTSHNNSHLFKDSNGSKPDSSLSFSATNAIISLLITSPDSNHKKEKGVGGGGRPPVKREGASTAILVFLLLSTKLFFFFSTAKNNTVCCAWILSVRQFEPVTLQRTICSQRWHRSWLCWRIFWVIDSGRIYSYSDRVHSEEKRTIAMALLTGMTLVFSKQRRGYLTAGLSCTRLWLTGIRDSARQTNVHRMQILFIP